MKYTLIIKRFIINSNNSQINTVTQHTKPHLPFFFSLVLFTTTTKHILTQTYHTHTIVIRPSDIYATLFSTGHRLRLGTSSHLYTVHNNSIEASHFSGPFKLRDPDVFAPAAPLSTALTLFVCIFILLYEEIIHIL